MAHPSKQHTILLADDEMNLRTLVRTTLEGDDCRILEAADGTSALDLAQREHPDVVVLDVMMPGMTGLEVLRRLRGEARTARIPVVMLTATGQDKDRERALELGADAYLVKPFSPLELLQAVESLRDRAGEAADLAGGASEAEERVAAVEEEPEPGSQLALYARDLKHAFEAERARTAELARANERLQLLDRLKTDFLSFISHELRTPLNAMAMVDLVESSADPAEQRETLELVRSGYERLEVLIERGLAYFNWMATDACGRGAATTDLGALLETIAGHARAHVPGATIELGAPAAACVVRGCEEHLRTALEAVLDNALKFSRDPWVRVDLRRTAGGARVEVRDRGVGFPPELAEEIFRPFTVADAAHHSQGTALNLALARAILDAHGGAIRAESAGPGSGATFHVDLPT